MSLINSRSQILIIEPGRYQVSGALFREIWQYKELLGFLVLRDLKVRYKQASLGIAWALLQPISSMVVFTVFFGNFARMPSDGIPYHLFSFAAMWPWNFFSSTLTRGCQSVVNSSNLLSKVYFPRLLVPMASVGVGIVDYAVGTVVLFGLMFFQGYPITLWMIFWLINLTLLTAILCFGVSAALGALNVRYRDVSHLVPFGLQVWMFATPIIYPTRIIPEKYKWAVALNPMSGIIEAFRAVLFGQAIPYSSLGLSLIFTAVFLVFGTYYFVRTERQFADLI